MSAFFQHAGEKEAQELAEKLHFEHGNAVPVAMEATNLVVIQWGASLNEVPDAMVLQPVKAVLRAKARDKRDKLLHMHGIKTLASHGSNQHQEVSFPYHYKVAVFHLETLAVYEKKETVWVADGEMRRNSSSYVEVHPELATYHVRRASREAIRALYALDLDYGIVTIGVTPQGHTIVLDVDPVPKLGGRLLDLFAQAMNKYDASLAIELQRAEPTMLGSDPEFLLLSPQGKVVSASRFLEREGAVGCDAIVLSGHRVILPLAELRPQPSTSPRELTRNLHRTMQLAARKITDESLTWLSGGMPLKGFPLGGHIHFSRCWLNSHLLRALDTYLALPLMLIEGETTRQRRPRYGFLGDFRRQTHGGFEYRTLPSWLNSPAIASGVLALASLIADHYRKLPITFQMDSNIQAYYYSGDKEKLLTSVALHWQLLEGLGEPYDRYAADLKPLKDMVLNMKPWDESKDIRRTWRITPFNRKEAINQQFML